MFDSLIAGARRAGLTSQPCLLLPARPWVNHVTFMDLSFAVCEMGAGRACLTRLL